VKIYAKRAPPGLRKRYGEGMPAKSAAQERLMQGVAHNPKFARKVGIPQSVGAEFVDAGPERDSGRAERATPRAGEPRAIPAATPAPRTPKAVLAGEAAHTGRPPSQGHAAAMSILKPRRGKVRASGNPF
jgi:hypothetical protein